MIRIFSFVSLECLSIFLQDETNRSRQADFYQLFLWLTDEQDESEANIRRISSSIETNELIVNLLCLCLEDKTSELLKDLLPNTKYSFRFESIQHRHENQNEGRQKSFLFDR